MNRDEMSYISLLERITGVTAKDCIWDSERNRIIFVLREGNLGKVVGKGGVTIRRIREQIKKSIDVVEYDDDPTELTKNALSPAKIKSVTLATKGDRKTVVVTVASATDKGKAIGKTGWNISRAKLLLKRYFDIDNILINEVQKNRS
ncbi:MAG: NusA-like transcription termination signal-binding factor [Promethearchaeota archaeon]